MIIYIFTHLCYKTILPLPDSNRAMTQSQTLIFPCRLWAVEEVARRVPRLINCRMTDECALGVPVRAPLPILIHNTVSNLWVPVPAVPELVPAVPVSLIVLPFVSPNELSVCVQSNPVNPKKVEGPAKTIFFK